MTGEMAPWVKYTMHKYDMELGVIPRAHVQPGTVPCVCSLCNIHVTHGFMQAKHTQSESLMVRI